jgi:hypothetical protein
LCDIEENVYCCGPVSCLDVAGCDDAGLLLGFVELPFFDSARSQREIGVVWRNFLLSLQAHDDLFDFGTHLASCRVWEMNESSDDDRRLELEIWRGCGVKSYLRIRRNKQSFELVFYWMDNSSALLV